MITLSGWYLIKLSRSSNNKRSLVAPGLLTIFMLCLLLKTFSFMPFSKESSRIITFFLSTLPILSFGRFFIYCFSTSSLTLPWAIAGFLHTFYTFSPAHRRLIRDTFVLTFPGFSYLPQVLRFWASAFYPQVFFTLHSSFFCNSDAGRNTPSRTLLCACPHKVTPSGQGIALKYLYCSYKVIDLSIVPVSHRV